MIESWLDHELNGWDIPIGFSQPFHREHPDPLWEQQCAFDSVAVSGQQQIDIAEVQYRPWSAHSRVKRQVRASEFELTVSVLRSSIRPLHTTVRCSAIASASNAGFWVWLVMVDHLQQLAAPWRRPTATVFGSRAERS
jgi:hypothetical protein